MKLRNTSIRPSSWHRHPAIRSGDTLTRGERAADKLRNGMGSWGFVFGAMIFLAGWMIGNRNVGFDKYPFILLNLILSCLAAMQGAILLIAAKREDQISSDLASTTTRPTSRPTGSSRRSTRSPARSTPTRCRRPSEANPSATDD